MPSFFLRLAALALYSVGLAGAAEAPPEKLAVQFDLVRYDMPLGQSEGYAPTRQLAVRMEGADAVDWPDLKLNGQPIFRERAAEKVELQLRSGAAASSPFQSPGDDVIRPGNHWLRAISWRPGRQHLYTADNTARCSNTEPARYELWAFPIVISGEGGPVIKNVEVKSEGAVIFRKAGPWRSLTLLLPENEPGKHYELSVDGRPPVKFEAGLRPVKLGDPHERVRPVKAIIAGEGPKLTVANLAAPEEFPNPKEWEADVAALASSLPVTIAPQRSEGFSHRVGIEVPHSPLTIYAMALPHRKSGGFFKKGMDPDQYADFIAETGYDAIFDPVDELPAPGEPGSLEGRAAALARKGVRLGLQYDNISRRPSLQHPNLAFLSHTLPEWHAPLYRSLSLAVQRFARLPNFAGISIGSDNAGYASFQASSPPHPDRPWGEAMTGFMDSPQPRVPRAPSLGPGDRSFEVATATQAEFVKYAERYETSFQQYGYFAEAVRAVDPRIIFTTGSFGSSPGPGARGGWPWASIPARVMFEGLSTQQAYDSNSRHSSKPIHNAALIDRLRSYQPKKTTWTIIDNFQFLFGREAFQRACALALTRGVQGVGANFLANLTGDNARPDVIQWQKEMHSWMRKFGGVYARTEPAAVIGIFYGHHQAIQRRIVSGETPSEEELLRGSHEGKVTEALFLCHAAGWPARVITYQEIRRGALPSSMKAILLTGMDAPDESWKEGLGLAPQLQQFVAAGGRILADHESVSPIPCTQTGMNIAAYVPQSDLDATPLLIARNAENIAKLRAAMEGVAEPIAFSGNPLMWAIPAIAGDVQYVTAINQAFAEGDEANEMLRPADPKAVKPEIWKTKRNASLYVKPQKAVLKWNTDLPIYDVRLGRKISREVAADVDLTTDAFRWYAIPPAEITVPALVLEKAKSGFYEAQVTVSNPERISGIPVRVTVSGAGQSATVYSSTGVTAQLPLKESDAGDYLITATELLSGLSATTELKIPLSPPQPTLQSGVRIHHARALAKFAGRKLAPLCIGLTLQQAKDKRFAAHAETVRSFFQTQGRDATIGVVGPGGVVQSLQPGKTPHPFPRWRTIESDLVLFGTPANNVLLLDQVRAEIFPKNFSTPAPGEADLIYTWSPFVGECDAVNVVATDEAGMSAAIRALTSGPRAPSKRL